MGPMWSINSNYILEAFCDAGDLVITKARLVDSVSRVDSLIIISAKAGGQFVFERIHIPSMSCEGRLHSRVFIPRILIVIWREFE